MKNLTQQHLEAIEKGLANHFSEDEANREAAKACTAITEQVAIGFKNWIWDEVYDHDWDGSSTKEKYRNKDDKELFELYIKTQTK